MTGKTLFLKMTVRRFLINRVVFKNNPFFVALDGRELYDLGGSAHMLRYCRTIAAWYDAASAVVLNARRYPLPFDVYHVDALPTKHKLAEEELFSFRKRCLTYFEERAATDPKYDSALIFLQEKLGDNTQVEAAALNAANAMVHAEATVMGLACISVLGGESFGEVSIEDVRKMFPVCFRRSVIAICSSLFIGVGDHNDSS